MKWFKFYGQDFLTDPKIKTLSTERRMCWIILLCLANAEEKDGRVRFVKEEDVMSLSGIEFDGQTWYETIGFIELFKKLEMITIDNNDNGLYDITLKNFTKRQEAAKTGYERLKKYRENKKSLSLNEAKLDTNDNDDNENDNGRIDKNREDKIRKDDAKHKEVMKPKLIPSGSQFAKEVREKYKHLIKASLLVLAFFLLPVQSHAKTISVKYSVTIDGYKSSVTKRPAVDKSSLRGTATLNLTTTAPQGAIETSTFNTALSELTSDQEWAIISKMKYPQVIAQIYKGESNFGRHDICRQRGGYNGFGFGESNPLKYGPTCYATFEEVVANVDNWIADKVDKGFTLSMMNCYYVTGDTNCRWNTAYKLE